MSTSREWPMARKTFKPSMRSGSGILRGHLNHHCLRTFASPTAWISNNHRQQNLADSGHWPLLRYDPRKVEQGQNPIKLDSKAPSIPYEQFARTETRFTMLAHPTLRQHKIDVRSANRMLLIVTRTMPECWRTHRPKTVKTKTRQTPPQEENH